jgi:hypothetical protein
MWFDPLSEIGTLMVGAAALLSSAGPFFKKSKIVVTVFGVNTALSVTTLAKQTGPKGETFA